MVLRVGLARQSRPRIFSMQGKRLVASDNFTDADATTLEAHVPTGGGTFTKTPGSGAGDIVIAANRIYNTDNSVLHFSHHSLVPATPNYDVEGDVVVLTDNNLGTVGVTGRASTSAQTHYMWRYNLNGNAWQLYSVVASTSVLLGSSVQVLTPEQVYVARLSMRGSTIVGLVNGAPVVSAVDTAITAVGRPGVRLQLNATATTGIHLDAWRVFI